MPISNANTRTFVLLGLLICIRRVIRRQRTLSHVTSDQCTHSYWKYTNRYLRCIHITQQPFRVHSGTNNDDTRQQLYILIKHDQNSTHYHVTWEQCEHSADSWRDLTLLTASDVTWSHVTSAWCVFTFSVMRNVSFAVKFWYCITNCANHMWWVDNEKFHSHEWFSTLHARIRLVLSFNT
jgi:hypothetical protein